MAKKKNDIADLALAPYTSEAFCAMYPNYATASVAPLRPQDVEWKIQSTKDDKTIVVPYVTNRYTFRILTHIFGLDNFKMRVNEIPIGTITEQWDGKKEFWHNRKKYEVDTKCTEVKTTMAYKATISIRTPQGDWVDIQDGSEQTDIEPTKGGISGAYKRALVGIIPAVSELYAYPKVTINEKVWNVNEYEGLSAIVQMYNDGKIASGTQLTVSKTEVMYWKTVLWKAGQHVAPKADEKKADITTDTTVPAASDYDKAKVKLIGNTVKVSAAGKEFTGKCVEYSADLKDKLIEYVKGDSNRKFFIKTKVLCFCMVGDDVAMMPVDSADVEFYTTKWKFAVITDGKVSLS